MATKKKSIADEPKSKAEPKAKAASESKAEPKGKAEAKSKAEPKGKVEPESKAEAKGNAKPKPKVEVDWGKGFVEHHDAVVSGTSVKVPIPQRVRQALGQSQTKGRYDRIRLKLDGQEARISERRYYKTSEAQPSLTFEIAE